MTGPGAGPGTIPETGLEVGPGTEPETRLGVGLGIKMDTEPGSEGVFCCGSTAPLVDYVVKSNCDVGGCDSDGGSVGEKKTPAATVSDACPEVQSP